MKILRLVVLGFLALGPSYPLSSQTSTASSTTQGATAHPSSNAVAPIKCLSPSYQAAVQQYVPATQLSGIMPYLPQLSADDCFLDTVGMLPQTADGRAFVFSKLDAEPSAKLRTLLLTTLSWRANDAAEGRAPLLSANELRILEAHAASDPDVDASLEALAVLRAFHTAQESSLLKKREASVTAGDSAAQKELEARRLEYYDWSSEIRMPVFAYDPPPLFSAVPSGKAIRVLAFGDFGTGSDGQMKAASAMRAYASTHPFTFGITLGDNFYRADDGTRVDSPDSPRWQTQWEQPYGGLGIRFFPVLGNNDYVDPDSPAAEIAYTQKSKTWDFPAPYYTYTAGAAQFFAIDTMRLSDTELDWLDRELAKSTAKWKIVYGHYPVYSVGANRDTPDLIAKLLPILEKDHVEIYMCGHVHTMQDLQTNSSVHFYVTGAGGAGLATDLSDTYKRSVFKEATFGFTVLEIDDQHVDVIFVDSGGKEIYRSHLGQ
jgi:tartrate-resistant acid phosphatase type 5